MTGRVLLAWLALAAAGCAADQPPLRAQTPARRHVLLGMNADWPDMLLDGSIVDRAHQHFDLARCAQLCAAALGPGDRVAGCFRNAGLPPDIRARLPAAAHDAVLDCAIQ